jgi:ATP-binding cassette subfamily B (MDR/TAP) protein 7
LRLSADSAACRSV